MAQTKEAIQKPTELRNELATEVVKSKSKISTVWVNSKKNSCVAGVMHKECYQIKQRNNQQNWEILYNDILGFEFKEGFLYKLKVRIEVLDTSNLIDAFSQKYTLLKIIKKRKISN